MGFGLVQWWCSTLLSLPFFVSLSLVVTKLVFVRRLFVSLVAARACDYGSWTWILSGPILEKARLVQMEQKGSTRPVDPNTVSPIGHPELDHTQTHTSSSRVRDCACLHYIIPSPQTPIQVSVPDQATPVRCGESPPPGSSKVSLEPPSHGVAFRRRILPHFLSLTWQRHLTMSFGWVV